MSMTVEEFLLSDEPIVTDDPWVNAFIVWAQGRGLYVGFLNNVSVMLANNSMFVFLYFHEHGNRVTVENMYPRGSAWLGNRNNMHRSEVRDFILQEQRWMQV
jgi:hypothetical protein